MRTVVRSLVTRSSQGNQVMIRASRRDLIRMRLDPLARLPGAPASGAGRACRTRRRRKPRSGRPRPGRSMPAASQGTTLAGSGSATPATRSGRRPPSGSIEHEDRHVVAAELGDLGHVGDALERRQHEDHEDRRDQEVDVASRPAPRCRAAGRSPRPSAGPRSSSSRPTMISSDLTFTRTISGRFAACRTGRRACSPSRNGGRSRRNCIRNNDVYE